MRSERRRNGLGLGTILVLVGALLMALPVVSATERLGPNAVRGGISSSPAVPSGSSCGVGSDPLFDAYDPVTHDIYAPNYRSATVSVVSGACTVVGTVTLPSGAEPAAATFDPANDRVYVTGSGLNRVYELSGSSLALTIASSTFVSPWGIAYDPGDAVLAVANSRSNTVTFLSGNTVVGTTTVGSQPVKFAYDPFSDRFLVVNTGSDNVTSLSAIHPFDERANINIPVGVSPAEVAFDIADSEDYVADAGSNNVTLISGGGTQYGSVAVGSNPPGWFGIRQSWACMS